jgi:hypothetical protein
VIACNDIEVFYIFSEKMLTASFDNDYHLNRSTYTTESPE